MGQRSIECLVRVVDPDFWLHPAISEGPDRKRSLRLVYPTTPCIVSLRPANVCRPCCGSHDHVTGRSKQPRSSNIRAALWLTFDAKSRRVGGDWATGINRRVFVESIKNFFLESIETSVIFIFVRISYGGKKIVAPAHGKIDARSKEFWWLKRRLYTVPTMNSKWNDSKIFALDIFLITCLEIQLIRAVCSAIF